MTEANSAVDRYDILLAVLRYVLLEIRVSDDLRETQIFADIFHNAPSAISAGVPPDIVEKGILTRAAEHRCEPQIRSLFASARKNAGNSRRMTS